MIPKPRKRNLLRWCLDPARRRTTSSVQTLRLEQREEVRATTTFNPSAFASSSTTKPEEEKEEGEDEDVERECTKEFTPVVKLEIIEIERNENDRRGERKHSVRSENESVSILRGRVERTRVRTDENTRA